MAEAKKLVTLIATKLGQDEAGVRNLVKNAFEDIQVNLLWNLWGDEEVKKDQPEDEPAPEVSPPPAVLPAASAGA